MTTVPTVRIQELLDRFNNGELAAVDKLVADAYFGYEPGPDEPSATVEVHRYAVDLKASAPDLAVEIPDLTPQSDGLLAGEATVSGTWEAPLWGVSPTGRHYEFHIPVRVRSVATRQ